MKKFAQYCVNRFIQYLIVLFSGITIIFFIPRFTPIDPVQNTIQRVAMMGSSTTPEAVEQLRTALTELYGLKGTLWDQYKAFWKRLVTGDFGPSSSSFPTPVIQIIRQSLPWTMGLLLTSALLSWIIGNLMGAVAGFLRKSKWGNFIGIVAMIVFPIPYFLIALMLSVLFCYVWPIFPFSGGASVGVNASFSLQFMVDVIYHGILPSLSIVIIGFGGWFLTMRSVLAATLKEDYMVFGNLAGLSSRKLLFSYAMRNSILPQITGLAMSLGTVFSGSLATEYVFAYPGLGKLLYSSIIRGDFSLIMGTVTISIVAISTAVLIIDLIYPLFDPRIRLG